MIVKIPYWTTHIPVVWRSLEPKFRRVPRGYETDFKIGHTRVIIKVINEKPLVG